MSEKPQVKIRGKRSQNTEKKEKAKHSNWFLTISTNQRYTKDDPHKDSDAEVMDEVVQDLLKNLHKYVKVGEGHTWSKQYIDDCDASYAVEYGPKTKALHTHIFLKCKHHTNLKLDYEGIKDKIKESLGLKNVYMNAKIFRTTTDQSVEEYLDKYHY